MLLPDSSIILKMHPWFSFYGSSRLTAVQRAELDLCRYFSCFLVCVYTFIPNISQDLPAAQLKRCKGYAGNLVGLVCKQKETLSLASGHVQVLR